MNEAKIFAIERPSPQLLKLYIIRSLLSLIFFPIVFPILFFRYYTMRYRFDEEGVGMRWGLFFKKEINLTYSRIQDIHLNSGIIQRWLGLADIQLQTASGNAQAEMNIEGILFSEELRDFLYMKMRGTKTGAGLPDSTDSEDSPDIKLLTEIRDEISKARQAIERLAEKKA
jgi:putative membrane protein